MKPEKWRTYNPSNPVTPHSIRWHLVRNLDLAQTVKIEVEKWKEGRLPESDYITVVYYSRGNEENADYIQSKKDQFEVDHVYLHTLRHGTLNTLRNTLSDISVTT